MTGAGGLRALGIDAAGKHGWLGVLVDAEGFVDANVGTLADLVRWAGDVTAIGIDIPIGAVGGGARRADVEARRFIGVRASSVFPAPPAEVRDVGTYDEANALLVSLGAPKLSRQAWALVPRIAEADALARVDARVFEVHPEVSFRQLNGAPVPWSKKSWNGLHLRHRLLADAGIAVPPSLPDVAGVVSDDVVDAAVAAWSARRIAAGTARTFPDPPERCDDRAIAIWC